MQIDSTVNNPGPLPVFHRNRTAGTALYHAYGLNIRSELPLPEFTRLSNEEASHFNVAISFTPEAVWTDSVRHLASSWTVDPFEARFWFRGVGGFEVLTGNRILISPEPDADDRLLRMYVEGMMMATLLYQRGNFVLHSSVVAIGESSAAFLGHVGAGKSSTAAALHARGHAVVTDDNAAIDLSAASPHVTPAFPYIKVFPAIAAVLGYSEESLTRMHSSQPKCVREVARDFPTSPSPLGCLYVLNREAPAAFEQLSRPEATLELVRNSVPTRWKLAGGACHLRQCATLASSVPVYRVRTFTALDELPELAASIEQHFSSSRVSS